MDIHSYMYIQKTLRIHSALAINFKMSISDEERVGEYFRGCEDMYM